MELTQQQLQQFDEQGFLFFPSLFSPDEARALQGATHEVFGSHRKEVWRENSGAPRTAFAAHRYNDVFACLGAHPRLVNPVSQLVDGPVYMHQFKVNAKAAFDGDVWQWHQDYGTWQRDDDMPTARAMNIAVFIDDVSAVNGPLLFITGSHKHGVINAKHDSETTSYPLWAIGKQQINALCEQGECVAPTGPAGSVLVFSSLLVHASPPNISPYNRTIVYLSLCHVDNHIRSFKRDEWVAHRDFTPIIPMADDCLSNTK